MIRNARSTAIATKAYRNARSNVWPDVCQYGRSAALIETLVDVDLDYPKVREKKLEELAAAKRKLLSR